MNVGINLENLEKLVIAHPEIRVERVEELARAIKQGGYKVTAEQIAETMLSDLCCSSSE